ncbi:MAG: prefoldin subunit alpha [Desulfurococcales archaeon]|nr:prefoldin subunit alpha [Desulfurococcales archaeon]
MSKKPQEQTVIDPNALLMQAQELAQIIENLRSLLANLGVRRDSISKAKETIEAIGESEEPILAPADPEGLVFYRTQPVEKDKFLVHLGLDVYALLSREKAIESLAKKEAEISKEISIVSERLEEARRQYEAIQSILQQLAMKQVQARRQQ